MSSDLPAVGAVRTELVLYLLSALRTAHHLLTSETSWGAGGDACPGDCGHGSHSKPE